VTTVDFEDFEKITDDIEIDPSQSTGSLWWIAAALFLIFGPYMAGCVIWLIQSRFDLALSSISVAPFFVIYLIFFMQPRDRTGKVLLALGCLPLAIALYIWAGAHFRAPIQKVPNLSSVSGGYMDACGRFVDGHASLVQPLPRCPEGGK
jgi:drug/metabolite transporter superfamily protein YnfA